MKQRWHKAINVGLALALVVTVLVLALFLQVTPVVAAEVTIHADLFDATDEYSPSPNVVFISDQVGYAFFMDHANDNVAYSKTIDGGGSWGSAVALSGVMGTDKDWVSVAVWYDRWTPGGSGTKIHIAASEVDDDDIWYNWLDTSDDTMRAGAIVVSQLGYITPDEEGAPSIIKSTDGYLFILAFHDNTAAVQKSINSGDNWTDTAIPKADINRFDQGQLLPLSGGDIIIILQDESADKAQSKVYDEETDAWDSTWADIGTWVYNGDYVCNWGASLFKSTGDIYLAGNTMPDGGTSYPLKAYKFTESTRTWSTLTDIAAVDGALQVTMAVDQNNGDLYAIYSRGSRTGQKPMNVYYKKSVDGGSTWGPESSALNTSVDDYRYVRTNFTSNERIYAVWYDDDDNDLFGNTVANITPPVGQSWYLSSTAGSWVMYKGDDTKTAGTVTVADDGSEIWIANEAATVNVAFPANTWTGHITFDGTSLDTTVRVYVGSWDGSSFTPSGDGEFDDVSGSSDFSFSASAFDVPKDEWLACKIEDYADGDSDSVIVSVGGNNSYLTSGANDPGYPIPELPTIILLGAGLAGLGGYIAFMRRKRRSVSP